MALDILQGGQAIRPKSPEKLYSSSKIQFKCQLLLEALLTSANETPWAVLSCQLNA